MSFNFNLHQVYAVVCLFVVMTLIFYKQIESQEIFMPTVPITSAQNTQDTNMKDATSFITHFSLR
jgi:hypothetical protein